LRVADRYKKIFGQIESLAEEVPWSTGLSNMLEWLTWSTRDVLGITKTRFWNQIVELSDDPAIKNGTLEEKKLFVKHQLARMILESESHDRYDRPTDSLAGAREALRRAKYFSEDYLNKEFDIFWGLVSDSYLDSYYAQFFGFEPGGKWYCHGNSGLFAYSTGIESMQMDNLSYNPKRQLLVANELKLGGKKNRDQILKYALMFRLLTERGFISNNCRFVLLFIGDRPAIFDWEAEVEAELAYCRASPKSTAKAATNPHCIEIAKRSSYFTTTWRELFDFNERFVQQLDPDSQQVEQKLLRGFNASLSAKAFFDHESSGSA
jgi:hypothetical protein